MSKQFYYAVFYDTEMKEWCVDLGISLNYDSGEVWNTETEEWEMERDETMDNEIINQLKEKLSEKVSA